MTQYLGGSGKYYAWCSDVFIFTPLPFRQNKNSFGHGKKFENIVFGPLCENVKGKRKNDTSMKS